MCYTISNNNKSELKLQKVLGATYPKKLGQLKIRLAVSGFTHPEWPIVSMTHPNEIQLFNWGLIPQWTGNPALAKQFSNNNLNSKAESIFEKVSFRTPIKTQRCIIPVTGFFEWRTVNKIKYPYYIHLKEEELFCLGGIHDEWINKETAERNNTFSIITTEANPLMAKVHNLKKRMPLILSKDKTRDWLNPNLSESDINLLMKPYDENLMSAFTINTKRIEQMENSQNTQSIEPFIYPELDLLDQLTASYKNQ